jgi:hypothetical protein
LYPAPIPQGMDDDRFPRVSFFNPKLLDREEANDGWTGTVADEADRSKRRWLFVLGSLDLECQRSLLGSRSFPELFLEKLHQTAEAGRIPVVIAPQELALMELLPPNSQVEVLTHCPFTEFMSNLMRAEYAFYWNAFSCSMLPRLINRLPTFFFDRGHLTRTVKPFYPLGMRYYFDGLERPFLDVREALTVTELSGLAATQKEEMERVLGRLRSLPTPKELIERLVHEHDTAWS